MVEIKCQDRVKRELSICNCLLCLDLEFSRVNQIKPQAPGGVLRHFSQVSACDHTPPRTQKTLISHEVLKESQSKRPSISSRHGLWLKYTTVPQCRGSPSFLINENILGTTPAQLASHVPLSLPTTGFATSSSAMFARMNGQEECGQHASSNEPPPRPPPTHTHTSPPPPTHPPTHTLTFTGKKTQTFSNRCFFKKKCGAKPVCVFLFLY